MNRLLLYILLAVGCWLLLGSRVAGQSGQPPAQGQPPAPRRGTQAGQGEGTLQDTRGSTQPPKTNPNPTIQGDAPAAGQPGVPNAANDPVVFGAITATPFFYEQAVRTHLGLSVEQYNRLAAVYAAAYRTYTTRLAALNLGEGPQRAARVQELANAFFSDFATAAAGLVNEPQIVRLRQLWYQFRGFEAFHDPAVQQRLRLTTGQLADLARLEAAHKQRLAELYRAAGGDRTLAARSFTELQRRMANDINSVLTHAQQRIWAEVTGDPFSFQPFVSGPTVTAGRP